MGMEPPVQKRGYNMYVLAGMFKDEIPPSYDIPLTVKAYSGTKFQIITDYGDAPRKLVGDRGPLLLDIVLPPLRLAPQTTLLLDGSITFANGMLGMALNNLVGVTLVVFGCVQRELIAYTLFPARTLETLNVELSIPVLERPLELPAGDGGSNVTPLFGPR